MAGIILIPIYIALVYYYRRAYLFLIIYLVLWAYWIGSGVVVSIEANKQLAMVRYEGVRYAPEQCGRQKPMQVILRNDSDVAVSTMRYTIEGVTRGFTVINYRQEYEEPWFVAPHTTWSNCVKLPRQVSFDNVVPPDQTKWFLTDEHFEFTGKEN